LKDENTIRFKRKHVMKRIAIVGNGGGGKTTLSRGLGAALGLPVYHVDSLQFQPGWKVTPQVETSQKLDQIAQTNAWIIDGFGTKEVIERRFNGADTIVFVDFPLWRHYGWAFKRQMGSFKKVREELPENCPEFSLQYTWKLFRAIWRVHKEYRPWFREKIQALPPSTQCFHIKSKQDWQKFYAHYCE